MSISRKARREIVLILLLLACFPLMYRVVFGSGGYLGLRTHRAELEKLQLENQALRQERNEILENIRLIKTDPAELERIARERYQWARPGDVILQPPRSDE